MIIAEIGQNYQGCSEEASRYVEALCEIASLDGLTFQIREKDHRERKPYLYFDWQHYHKLSEKTKTAGKLFGVAITDDEMLDFFEKDLKVDFYKVIRDGVYNKELLTKLANTNKPVLVSVGLCSEQDIQKLSELLSAIEGEIRLIYTNRSSVRLQDINLSAMNTLRKYWEKVGYGSHCEDSTNLLLAMCCEPTDILFYVKNTSSTEFDKFPDSEWAVDLSKTEKMIDKLMECRDALGDGSLK